MYLVFIYERDNNWFLNGILFLGGTIKVNHLGIGGKALVFVKICISVHQNQYPEQSLDKGSDPTKSILRDKPVTYQNIFDLKE